jgi:hypothetical protein
MSERQLPLSWAINHFSDEILQHFSIANGLPFEHILQTRNELEIRSWNEEIE